MSYDPPPPRPFFVTADPIPPPSAVVGGCVCATLCCLNLGRHERGTLSFHHLLERGGVVVCALC